MYSPYDLALMANNGTGGNNAGTVPTMAPFGKYADQFKNEGWFPETTYNGVTVFRSNFKGPHNQVMLDGKPTGHIAFLGNANGKFDIVIRDQNGNVKHTIATNQAPEALAAYTKNNVSPVAVRNDRIIAQAKSK